MICRPDRTLLFYLETADQLHRASAAAVEHVHSSVIPQHAYDTRPQPGLFALQIRQARPIQRPARLLNNALEDGGSMNLNEAERAPALPAAPAMLPGEDRIRFWRKERSLLAVALHVKPGMTRAAEFLVPVQLCNRALSVAWPLGMFLLCKFLSRIYRVAAFCKSAAMLTFPACSASSATGYSSDQNGGFCARQS